MNSRGRGDCARSAARDAWKRADSRQAALRRRRHGPDQQDALHLARRQRPSFRNAQLRRAAGRLRGAGARPDRRRVDVMLLVETIFDTLNAKAAIWSVRQVLRGARDFDTSAHDLGHDHRPPAVAPSRARPSTPSGTRWPTRSPLSVGINCSLGARRCGPILAELSPSLAPTCFVSCYPNAGLPNAFGEYDETAGDARPSCCASSPRAGSSTCVGGCCGTTPEHIRAIAEVADGGRAAHAPEHEASVTRSSAASRPS